MTGLSLDRMEIEEAGANPIRLAAAIHGQLGKQDGPVPVHAIARELDIIEIREESLSSLEGALVTTPERGWGSILLNASSSPRRRRFTLGHELGHFLNPYHVTTAPEGFRCSRSDMIQSDLRAKDRHFRQEAEANAFAIELLAPRHLVRPHLSSAPDLTGVLAMAEDLDISREAAARRYVELHGDTLAVVFSRHGRCLYTVRAGDCPPLLVARDTALPEVPAVAGATGLSTAEEADAADWLINGNRFELVVQTLHQQDGHATTLLRVCDADGDEHDGLEDAYDRFNRFGR